VAEDFAPFNIDVTTVTSINAELNYAINDHGVISNTLVLLGRGAPRDPHHVLLAAGLATF
jgi:hypothetical protein